MNNVSLLGRFSKNPELRYSESGTAICNFTLAVRNPYDKDGNADFIQCVAWSSGAELVAQNHKQGDMIAVDGRIATRYYENNDNQRVYVTEVNVNSIHLLPTKEYYEKQNNTNSSSNSSSSNGNGNKNNGNKNNTNRNNGNGNRSTNRQNP